MLNLSFTDGVAEKDEGSEKAKGDAESKGDKSEDKTTDSVTDELGKLTVKESDKVTSDKSESSNDTGTTDSNIQAEK